ncbi:MAG TPA: HI0074 family nucleotidyltransferase substrate-binding subunit [Thermoanaerobaculia bacterium]|nr:HI0074 family nucleotidyltransferase substrate-binding subunit [Thermoanaerobaculia bacterium]
MGELTRRLALARRALATLREALREPPSALVRDASIQRFEYGFETAWKAAQRFLRECEGVEAASPSAAVRQSHAVGLLEEADAREALEMVSDRNLTTHTYNEALAIRIFGRLSAYADLIDRWLAAIEARSGQS